MKTIAVAACLALFVSLSAAGQPASHRSAAHAEPNVRLSVDGGRCVVEVRDPDVTLSVQDGGRRVELKDSQTGTKLVFQPQTFELVFDPRTRLAIEGSEFRMRRDGVVVARIIRHTPDESRRTLPQIRPVPQTGGR